MDVYRICGGRRLVGETEVCGAKNAVLPLLAACVLIKDTVKLKNCPRLSDIEGMLGLLRALGCDARREGRDLYIDASHAQMHVMPEELSKRMRSSIFMLGPVLARMGRADFTYPGGCEIGLRPIDLHLQGLRALGAKVEERHGHILCSGRLRGASVHLDYPSVGATENVMLAAVCAQGDSVIHNAAREPEITDLGRFLNRCGADVRGMGTGTIHIKGNAELHGVEYEPVCDRIAAGTLLMAGAATQGDVFVRGAQAQQMQAVLAKLKEAGCMVQTDACGVRVQCARELRAVRRIETAPFPGFPTDLQAQMMALLTKGRGASVIAENVFENRMQHVAELTRMGADIQVSGRIAVVRGVEKLTGARVETRDLRGGAALCIAALMAQGESVIENIALIDRGHDRLEDDLAALGAEIYRKIQKQ